MNPDPTEINSLDYIVELTDDGKESEPVDAELVILPPPTQATNASSTTTRPPEPGPQK